jgi:hypothetical protein
MLSFNRIFWSLVVVAMALVACEEPEGIGLDVLPAGEEMPIAWVDTFTVYVRTVTDDSVSTSNLSGTYLIGDFQDPDFGRVQARLYTQFHLPSTNIDFGTGATIDSIIINLAYNGSYGSTDKLRGMQRFGVYRLTEDIYDSATYYSNVSHEFDPTPIGTKEFRPDLFSNVDTGTDTLPPSFRIRLDDAFGTSILNSSNLASNEDFLTEFKGLMIRSDSPSLSDGFGAILYFNMLSTASRVEVYYHNFEDTLNLGLVINADCATHTAFDHEFPQTIVDAVQDSFNYQPDQVFIQSMAGLKMKVMIPHLRKLNDLGIVAINKAELVIPLDEDFDTEFGVPNNLQATRIDYKGASQFMTDFYEGSDYFGGAYDSDKKQYVFNIARHLQSIILETDSTDYGMYILNSGNAVNGRRAVFNGPTHPDKPLKLRMTYTIIE